MKQRSRIAGPGPAASRQDRGHPCAPSGRWQPRAVPRLASRRRPRADAGPSSLCRTFGPRFTRMSCPWRNLCVPASRVRWRRWTRGACFPRLGRGSEPRDRAAYSVLSQRTPSLRARSCTGDADRLVTRWRSRTVIIGTLTTISTIVAPRITMKRPWEGIAARD